MQSVYACSPVASVHVRSEARCTCARRERTRIAAPEVEGGHPTSLAATWREACVESARSPFGLVNHPQRIPLLFCSLLYLFTSSYSFLYFFILERAESGAGSSTHVGREVHAVSCFTGGLPWTLEDARPRHAKLMASTIMLSQHRETLLYCVSITDGDARD